MRKLSFWEANYIVFFLFTRKNIIFISVRFLWFIIHNFARKNTSKIKLYFFIKKIINTPYFILLLIFMDKLFFKLFLVILLWAWSFYYAFPRSAYNINAPFSWKDYKLWLDLQWWVELDYTVDLSQTKKEKDYNMARENSILEWLKSIVDKRVEALKINDSVITTANYGWEKHIIVQIPLKWTNKKENELNIKRAKEAIGKVMKIEFKETRTEITQADTIEREKISKDLLQESLQWKYDFSVTQAKYKDTYENVAIGSLTGTFDDLSKKYFSINKEQLSLWIYKKILTGTGIEKFSFENGKINQSSDNWFWILNIKNITQDTLDFDYAFISEKPSEWKPAADTTWKILNDKYFVNSSVQYNQAFQPMIELTFNDEWAKIFWELTTRLKGKQIAIFVWWEMLTAPTVNDAILTGKAVITGSYSADEATKLSQDINTWVVPAPIYLTSERTIDSKLGLNSLQKLITAWVYGFILIFLFLIVVYRLAGFASSLALIIYITMLLALVKSFWLTLTLASIAGLILSVGMAIDSNILIFARIKEELTLWHKLDKAIKDWFNRSWSAIWDTHLTWFITSIILIIFWINMIKWFGLMLLIWLLVSFFMTMIISRLFILIMSHKKDISHKIFIGMK